MFETDILWVLENKKHSQFRETWNILPHCLGRRQQCKVVKEREQSRHSLTEKLKQLGAPTGHALLGEEGVPLSEVQTGTSTKPIRGL